MQTIKVVLTVGDSSTNISLGDVRDAAVVVEALVSNIDLVPQFLHWIRYVPKDIRVQVFSALADSELFRQELVRVLEE